MWRCSESLCDVVCILQKPAEGLGLEGLQSGAILPDLGVRNGPGWAGDNEEKGWPVGCFWEQERSLLKGFLVVSL